MADILKKDPGIYERERDGFIRDLKHFHETRGTPIRRYPQINGKEIDLYLLYTLVTSKGGWIKVNQRNEWSGILNNFSTPKNCVNGEVALKQIYLRFLDRYEKIHFLGDTGDRDPDDEEDNRHKKWSARVMHSVPLVYNYHQHSVPDNLRSFHGLCTELYRSSDYDKLALSLISPLPNEQDFAINVCALLSGATSASNSNSNNNTNNNNNNNNNNSNNNNNNNNNINTNNSNSSSSNNNINNNNNNTNNNCNSDTNNNDDNSNSNNSNVNNNNNNTNSSVNNINSNNSNSVSDGKNPPSAFRLCDHRRLIHYLLGHAAVFNDCALRRLMEENYKEVRGYSMKYFWSDVLEDKELAILMDEKKFVKRRLKREREKKLLASRRITATMEYSSESSSDSEDNPFKLSSPTHDGGLMVESDDMDLFCVGRSYGTQDKFGQRVLQIGMIFRNATFIEENVPTLANDLTFLRFVLLCCGSRWNCIHQLGFDMLTNLASDIVLVDSIVDHLLKIISRGLESQDRAIVLSSIETLNKLGQKEENEDIMLRCVEHKVYERVCSFLTLHDIMILIQTLECLYSLSSLGERACNSIVHVHGAINTLVALVTVEAQSYGPKACILMRVVETITGGETTESDSVPITSSASMTSYPYTSVSTSSATVTSNITSSSLVGTSNISTGLNTPSLVTSCIPNVNPTIVSVSSLLHATPVPTPVVASPVTTATQQSRASTPLHTKPSTPNRGTIIPTVITSAVSSTTLPTSQSVIVTTSVVTAAIITTSTPATKTNNLPQVVQSAAEIQQDNENFATQWLCNVFEAHPTPGRGIEQGELYKQYLNACSRSGRKGCIAPSHFPQCVKSVFGSNVGPRQVIASKVGSESTASKIYVYEGIQVRPKPIQVTPTSTTNNPISQQTRGPSSPILKAQLSNPTLSTVIKKETKSKVSTSHPHLSNVLLGTGNIASSLSPSPAITQKCSSPLTLMTQKSNTPNVVIVCSVPSPALVTPTVVSSSTSTAANIVTTQDNSTVSANANNSNNTSLIKSLLASKVGDIIGTKTNIVKSDNNCLVTPSKQTPHQIVINKTAVPIQVTQRQQQQQQQQPIQQQSQLQQLIQQPQPASQLQQLMQQPTQQSQLQQLIQQPQIIHINQQKKLSEQDNTQQQHVIQVVSTVQPQQNQTQQSSNFQQQVGNQQQQVIQKTSTQQLITQDIEKILPQVCQQLVAAQKKNESSKQQIIVTDQIRQFLQGQQKTSQLSQLITQSSGKPGQQLQPQVQTIQHTQSTGGQQVQTLQQTRQLIQQTQQRQTESSQSVSVITSTAAVQANVGLKPFLSRINGMKNFQHFNLIITENKSADSEIKSAISNQVGNAATCQLMTNDSINQTFCNSDDNRTSITSTINTVIENSGNNVNNTVTLSSNKFMKTEDFGVDECSTQSLPVIAIRDPAGDDSGSNVIYNDYLINGISSNIKNETSLSDNMLDTSMSNNIMTAEDSLLNNIMMEDALASNIIGEDSLISNLSTNDNTNFNTDIKNEIASSNNEINKQNSMENMFVANRNIFGAICDPEKPFHNVIIKVEPKNEQNFANLLNTCKFKNEENTMVTKSNMLAELLEKTLQKKEPPILNGALRMGEKGLELITTRDDFKPFEKSSVICSGKKFNTQPVNRCNKNVSAATNTMFTSNIVKLEEGEIKQTFANEKVNIGVKRTNDQEVQCDELPKRPFLNGDTSINDDDAMDECNVKASSSAANLYAALAADVLGDIDGLEEEEISPIQHQQPVVIPQQPAIRTQTPSIPPQSSSPMPPQQHQQQTLVMDQNTQQLYLTSGPGNSTRQILTLTGPGSFSSLMGASGGQQLIVSPQTAIIQGQPQTVLVTQTTQQHGTPTKTIIILSPPPNATRLPTPSSTTTVVTSVPQQKFVTTTQKLQTGTSQVIVPTSLATNIRHTYQSKINSTQAQVPKTIVQNPQSTFSQTAENSQLLHTIQQSTSNNPQQQLPQISNVFSQQPQIQNVFSLQTQANSMMPQITAVFSHAANNNQNSVINNAQTVANPNNRTQQTHVIVQGNQINSSTLGSVSSQMFNACTSQSTMTTQSVTQMTIPSETQAVTTTVIITSTDNSNPIVTASKQTTGTTTVQSRQVKVIKSTSNAQRIHTHKTHSENLGQYICEWRSCMRSFKTANEVYLHACAAHCPSGSQEIQCLWEKCDAMKRKRFSLMTHLYDRHCNPEILRMMAVRRRQISQSGRSEIPPPLPPAPHPGYAPNAAYQAIRRHALEFVNPKELQDENEGPVTKSIRLTSSLILRNLVIYSTSGRRCLSSYEPHLASIASSNVESSRTIAQMIYDMNNHDR